MNVTQAHRPDSLPSPGSAASSADAAGAVASNGGLSAHPGDDRHRYSAGAILEMPRSRQRQARAARSVVALIALIGFLGSAQTLARAATEDRGSAWIDVFQHAFSLMSTIGLQAFFVLSGMIVTHTILRNPPSLSPRLWGARMLSIGIPLVPAAGLHGLGLLLYPAQMHTPRYLWAMVIAYPLLMTLSGLLLAPRRLRSRALGICVVVLLLWMLAALAVGPSRLNGPAAVVSASTAWGSGLERTTLVAVLSLGCCYWAGALVVAAGGIIDHRGPVIRCSVPLLALVGNVILMPPALTGASVAHLFLATALLPLLDARFPRFLGRHDLGWGSLLIGWPAAVLLSLLIPGPLAFVLGGILAFDVAVAAALALTVFAVAPMERALKVRPGSRPPRTVRRSRRRPTTVRPVNRVLVIAAHPAEIAHLPPEADAVVTGIGMSRAAAVTTRAVLERAPEPEQREQLIVVNLGSCGALDPGLSGVFEPSEVLNRDVDAALMIAMGSDPQDRIDLGELGQIGDGTILATGDSLVAGGPVRDALAQRAQLVDMEGFAVATACRELGVELRMAKHVSDDADAQALEWLERVDISARELAAWYSQSLAQLTGGASGSAQAAGREGPA